jgi:hypothetical protein
MQGLCRPRCPAPNVIEITATVRGEAMYSTRVMMGALKVSRNTPDEPTDVVRGAGPDLILKV